MVRSILTAAVAALSALVAVGATPPGNHPFATTIGSGVVQQLTYLETVTGPRTIALDGTRVYVVGFHPGGDFIARLTCSSTCAAP